MSKPRVWIAPYLRDWCFDITARAIAEHLEDSYEFRIAYSDDITSGELERWEADCIVDLWWHGTLHYRWGRRVVKQISSYRWQQQKWGSYSPAGMVHTYAEDVGVIVVPSKKLLKVFGEVPRAETATLDPLVMLAQKGFDPTKFFDDNIRTGVDLTTGWAGAIQSTDKGLDLLTAADPMIRIADGTLAYDLMPSFYNTVDVIAIASDFEGDPRPLIEGMACGCFPVTTDVGIVPELVRHLDNGYIVSSPSVEAFADAFTWCRNHLSYVRAAGAANAQRMSEERTWEDVMPSWKRAIDVALERSSDGIGPTRGEAMSRALSSI